MYFSGGMSVIKKLELYLCSQDKLNNTLSPVVNPVSHLWIESHYGQFIDRYICPP